MHLLLLLLAAAPPAAADEIVARVEGQPILASEIAARVAGGASRDAALSEMVDEAVLAAEGARQGLASDPAVVAEVAAARRRIAAERLLDAELRNVRPTEEMLRAAYHSKSDWVRLATIVLASREAAESAKARLRAGGDFAAEARNSLDMRSAGKGGDQGLQLRGQLPPALAEAAFAARAGEVAGPVALDLGFALLRVSERGVGDEEGFRKERPALEAFVAKQLAAQGRAHLLEQYRRQAGADLDVAFFERLGARLDATDAEADHAIAKVYGKPVRYGDVLPEIRRLARGIAGGHFSGPNVKQQVAREEVDRAVLEETALRRGLGDGPAMDTALARARRDALTRAVADRIRASIPPATDAELEVERQRRAKEIERPGRRACSHVLVRTEAEAKAARERLLRGEPFAAVASAVSGDASTASVGGQLGEITDAGLQEVQRSEPGLARAIEKARPGEPTPPVASHAGWHVLRCEARIPPGPPPLAEVRDLLAARVAKERGDDAVRRRMKDLRATARVAVDEPALARAAAPAR